MAERLIIEVDAAACTGCRVCEMVCTINREGVVNLDKANIYVTDNFAQSLYEPHICRLCDSPPCVTACPAEALQQDMETGVIRIDRDLCNGCEQCVAACPFQALRWSEQQKRLFVCDRCGGRPVCVEYCTIKALKLNREYS